MTRTALVLLPAFFCVIANAQNTGATFGQIINLGGTPSDIVVDDLRGRLYLVNDRANRIDIYGINEKSLIGAIGVGNRPLAAAISMDAAYLYVTNQLSSSLSVIDLSNNQVVQNITLPARPEGVEVGADGRALISTLGTVSGTTTSNTLLIFDRTQQTQQQLIAVQVPPPPTTPSTLPPTTLVRPTTNFLSKLVRSPDGQIIVGLTIPGQTTYMFVYEVASGVILRSRTVAGQSTVLSMSPDGSRFMAGFTLYETATLNVIAQQNTANAPFTLTPNFNTAANYGGSLFTPDGATIYSAFNVAQPGQRTNSSTLLVSDSTNLGISLGIKLPESIIYKMVSTADGSNAWALSESGLIYVPLSTLYDYPIIQPETTSVFLAVDECNRGLARASLRVNNLGSGRLTYSVPNPGPSLIASVTSGLAPSSINFTMEPGRTNVVRQAGTNLTTLGQTLQGQSLNITLSSPDAINIPNTIRVYMNFRQPDQRGVVYPVPVTLNNTPPNQNQNQPGGNEGLQDLLLDEPRGRLYITNSGYNRIEVFDIRKRRFLAPIAVGQLPHQMALASDGTTLYVGNTGGESISIVNLDQGRVTGSIEFPPLPRQGGGNNTNPAYPRALAMGLFGLQFVMSNGTQWKVIGNQAIVRPADSITLQANNNTNVLPGGPAFSMVATPGNEYVVTLDGMGRGYLYSSIADTYTSGRVLFGTTPIQSYYGLLAAGKGASFFLANGLVLNPSLTPIGGAERPGLPPVNAGTGQTTSAGTRNVAAVIALDENRFVRLTTPVRAAINTVTRDDVRPTLELVDVRTGGESLIGALAENPPITLFGTTRYNLSPQKMVADSAGTIYTITVSGLTVTPSVPATDLTKPQIATSRGIVNANDGTTNLRPGSFITVSGRSLAESAIAETIPAPTVLGGSCVTFNDISLPLLQTASGQILAQIPETVMPGLNVVQVRSLAMAQSSDPVVVTVQRAGVRDAPDEEQEEPEAPIEPPPADPANYNRP